MSTPTDTSMLERLYPDEADLIRGLRRHRRAELIEHVVLNYRESKRLYTELEEKKSGK